jgi:DNA-binding MarR family transcriptional regulator
LLVETEQPDLGRVRTGQAEIEQPGTRQAGTGQAGTETFLGAQEHAIAAAIDGLVAVAVRSGPRDISLTAASTLATLDRGGPCRLTDLAEIEGVAQPSMTTLVTGLERSGLAERRPSRADGRVVLVALTPAGADYLRTRRRARAAKLAGLISQLPAAQAAALADAVPAMVGLRDLDTQRRRAVRDSKAVRESEGATL